MARRKVPRDEADWKRVMAAWESSGQTQREFCDQQGLGFWSFTRWRTRLKSAPAASSGFIEVGRLAAPARAAGVVAVRVRLQNGVELDFWELPEPAWVRALLDADTGAS